MASRQKINSHLGGFFQIFLGALPDDGVGLAGLGLTLTLVKSSLKFHKVESIDKVVLL